MKQIALLIIVLSLSVVVESRSGKLSAEQLISPPNAQSLKFDFGPSKVAPGYTQVLQTTTYSKELGYGFEPDSSVTCVDRVGRDALRSDLCTSDQPFFFSVALPEGNYNVTITFGDQNAETNTTVKAELRRLMLETVHTAAGKFATRSFTVNIRRPQISTGGEVKLKDREKTSEAWAWDEKLSLEFNNQRPTVCAIEIAKVDVPTLFLYGDYPEAVRQVAREEKVPLIDLNSMSKLLYEAWGPDASKRAFAPNDGTHHNNYGSYELARCIVEGIKANKLGLRKFLLTDLTAFDPSHPDSMDSFKLPASPQRTQIKPPGS